MKTEVTKLFGIEKPIIQGGMAWAATSKLAAAVSNAGGLGIIGAANAPADVIREEIKTAKSLTDKPFGVNIMLLSPFADEVVEVVCEEKIAMVTTGAGNPAKYMKQFKDAGIKVVPVVASVAVEPEATFGKLIVPPVLDCLRLAIMGVNNVLLLSVAVSFSVTSVSSDETEGTNN